MSPRTIDGIDYVTLAGGILLPACYVQEPTKVRTPSDILPLLAEERIAETERVVVFTLDGNNQVIRKIQITSGLVNQSQIHPREVFREAIRDNAVSILVAHNHPSGNCEASEADLIATRRLVECSKTLGIPVWDHMIVAREKHFSLSAEYPCYFG